VESEIKRVARLCSDLIKLQDSADALNFCEAFLSNCGLNTKLFCFDKRHMALYTLINRRSNKTLYLIGHVDVVPPGIIERWKYNPYSGLILPTSYGLIVYGCGASDMKGGYRSNTGNNSKAYS
jgi:succinyl-diaminopimelate desuccinylase